MLRFIDLFAGIGGIRAGFQKAFIDSKCVFSSEIDKFARITYKANYNEEPSGDITSIDEKSIPEFDVLLAGFPCQPFSNAGLKLGLNDIRGTLFYEIARIANYHKPKVLFLENVKGFKNHDKGRTYKILENLLIDMGYKVYSKVLNAKDFGLPQNRERIYIIAFLDLSVEFEFPEKLEIPTKVGDILEQTVPDKYTISDKLWAGHQRRKAQHKSKGNGFGYKMFTENSTYTSTISARYGKDGSEILIYQGEDKNPRKLTPYEASKLQGFPNDFIIPVSDTQAYKQFGNSVPVSVISAISLKIKEALEREED